MCEKGASMNGPAFRIVQISDIHLFEEPEKALLGIKTNESFDAVIKLLKADQKPDMLLLSGDLSQDGSIASYTRVATKLKEFAIPTYYVLGNHDEAKIINETYPLENISRQRHIVLKDWHIILLNSQNIGAVDGSLDAVQLTFMQHCLQMYPEHNAIIVFHHHPIPVGSVWLDRLGLTNANELWTLLKSFPKVHTILFGHVHQEHEGQKNGIQYFSAPSTCFQFKRKSDDFAIEKLSPGYRWIDLYSDGGLKTGVNRAPEYVGEFDESARGY